MTINLRKNMSKIVKMFVLLLIIFSLTLININQEQKTTLTSTQGLSNKKIGWGIKRNDNHEQPDLGKNNIEVLEKNKDKHIVVFHSREEAEEYLVTVNV